MNEGRAGGGLVRAGAVSLMMPTGDSQQWTYADFVDVTEHAVSAHEEMEDPAVPA